GVTRNAAVHGDRPEARAAGSAPARERPGRGRAVDHQGGGVRWRIGSHRPDRRSLGPPRWATTTRWSAAGGRTGEGRSVARVVVVLCLVAAGVLWPTPAAAQGLPRAMAAIP